MGNTLARAPPVVATATDPPVGPPNVCYLVVGGPPIVYTGPGRGPLIFHVTVPTVAAPELIERAVAVNNLCNISQKQPVRMQQAERANPPAGFHLSFVVDTTPGIACIVDVFVSCCVEFRKGVGVVLSPFLDPATGRPLCPQHQLASARLGGGDETTHDFRVATPCLLQMLKPASRLPASGTTSVPAAPTSSATTGTAASSVGAGPSNASGSVAGGASSPASSAAAGNGPTYCPVVVRLTYMCPATLPDPPTTLPSPAENSEGMAVSGARRTGSGSDGEAAGSARGGGGGAREERDGPSFPRSEGGAADLVVPFSTPRIEGGGPAFPSGPSVVQQPQTGVQSEARQQEFFALFTFSNEAHERAVGALRSGNGAGSSAVVAIPSGTASGTNPLEELPVLTLSSARQYLQFAGEVYEVNDVFDLGGGDAAAPAPASAGASPANAEGGASAPAASPADNVVVDDGDNTCVICLTNPKNTTIIPCRHMCLCNECAPVLRNQSNKCPICRTTIEKLMTRTN